MARAFEGEDGPEDLTGYITTGTNGAHVPWVPPAPRKPEPCPMALREKLHQQCIELRHQALALRIQLGGIVL